LTATTVSKAILRAALDEFLREHNEDLNSRLFYFPSYEFVNELFPSRFLPDNRHPHDIILYTIMKTFEAAYCETPYGLAEAEALYQDVRNTMLQELPRLLPRSPKKGDKQGLMNGAEAAVGIAAPAAASSYVHRDSEAISPPSHGLGNFWRRARSAAGRRLKPVLTWSRFG
jgi:hypothetical protein